MRKDSAYLQAAISLKTHALDMRIGETRLTYCPFCGVSHEQSCSITKEETGILYNCFRATCKAGGFIPAFASGERVKKPEFEPRPFYRPLKHVPRKLLMYLEEVYGLTKAEVCGAGMRYDYTKQRLYLPIMDERGYETGAVSKRLRKQDAGPKVLTYFWSPLYNLHVADSSVVGGPVVVVEDILSATKVARHARCVALLGTSMSLSVAKRLLLLSKNIVMALDADTFSNGRSIGHKFKDKYGLAFGNFRVVKLSKDPKSMTHDEIREVILK